MVFAINSGESQMLQLPSEDFHSTNSKPGDVTLVDQEHLTENIVPDNTIDQEKPAEEIPPQPKVDMVNSIMLSRTHLLASRSQLLV